MRNFAEIIRKKMNDMNHKETLGAKDYIETEKGLENEQAEGLKVGDSGFAGEEVSNHETDEEGLLESDITGNGVGATDFNAGDSKQEGGTEASAEGKNSSLTEAEQLKKDLAESNDKYLRLAAEFDNFRKRTMRERSEMLKTAGKDVLVAVIPVIDDFERAERSMQQATDLNAVKEGLALIYSKFKTILTQQGLKEMVSIGQPFDTDRHEAITNVPAPSAGMKGKVLDETEKGYMIGDKVIRFAKVVVGQ